MESTVPIVSRLHINKAFVMTSSTHYLITGAPSVVQVLATCGNTCFQAKTISPAVDTTWPTVPGHRNSRGANLCMSGPQKRKHQQAGEISNSNDSLEIVCSDCFSENVSMFSSSFCFYYLKASKGNAKAKQIVETVGKAIQKEGNFANKCR